MGSFSATFFLIPFLGSKKTFAGCILLLLVLSLVGLAKSTKKNVFLASFALFLLFPLSGSSDQTLLYESESWYNLIRVYDTGAVRYMTLNNPLWVQSYDPEKGIRQTYREYFNLAPLLVDSNSSRKTILILGMSAGASVKELRRFYGTENLEIEAVEIDPKVVEVAETYFAVVADENFQVIVEDARRYLSLTKKKYDFIEIDLFHGGPEIPFHIATREFFQIVFEHTSSGGVVMMNVLGNPHLEGKNELILTLANTLAMVFSHVYLFPVSEDNTLLLTSASALSLEEVKKRLPSSPPELSSFAEKFSKELLTYSFSPARHIFTDDLSSIEVLSLEFYG